jgi:hypothetical protein
VGNTGLMNEHGLSESGEHEAEIEDGKLPSSKKKRIRAFARVCSTRKNQRLNEVKTKSKHP